MKEYIKCLECGKSFRYIIWKHLKKHNLTTKQYKEKYSDVRFASEASSEKISEYHKKYSPLRGKKNPYLIKLNKLRSGKNHPNYGKPLSEETKRKISEIKKQLFKEGKHPWIGRKHTEESKEKNRISHLRKNLSEETLRRMSKSHRGVPSLKKGLSLEQQYGKERSNLIRQKQSETKKGMYEGEKNPRWAGGVKLDPRGYIFIYRPDHPFNNQDYVQEHRLVMEKHLGRYLKPEEEVHHKNGIKNDNRIENLMLFRNKSEHMKFHKGKMSSGWRGGLSLESYPHRIFNKKLKEKIKIKYNKTCQLCGIKENELNGYFKKLSIHHINYIKKDCREENLIPLCHNCNSKTSNGDREYWTKLFIKK